MRKIIVPLVTGLSFVVCGFCAAPASAAPITPAKPATIKAYATVLRHINPQLPGWQSHELAKRVLSNALRFKVNANLLVALVSVESAWHTHARSRVGAIGLGQLMPGTAAQLGVNPHNADQNLSGAARYLGGLLSKYIHKANRYQLACAAYNAGPKAVARFGGIPPYAETQRYVVKVMSAWRHIEHTVHIPTAAVADRDSPATGARSDDISYWTRNR